MAFPAEKFRFARQDTLSTCVGLLGDTRRQSSLAVSLDTPQSAVTIMLALVVLVVICDLCLAGGQRSLCLNVLFVLTPTVHDKQRSRVITTVAVVVAVSTMAAMTVVVGPSTQVNVLQLM